MEKILKIKGMTCAHCASRVALALASINGVDNAKIDLVLNQAVITYSGKINDKALIKAVKEAGYDVL